MLSPFALYTGPAYRGAHGFAGNRHRYVECPCRRARRGHARALYPRPRCGRSMQVRDRAGDRRRTGRLRRRCGREVLYPVDFQGVCTGASARARGIGAVGRGGSRTVGRCLQLDRAAREGEGHTPQSLHQFGRHRHHRPFHRPARGRRSGARPDRSPAADGTQSADRFRSGCRAQRKRSGRTQSRAGMVPRRFRAAAEPGGRGAVGLFPSMRAIDELSAAGRKCAVPGVRRH